MTSHLWCWSDIVNPQLVEAAMADEERRARGLRPASNDAADHEAHDLPPVAA